MSSSSSSVIRVFRGCTALFSPAKSSTSAAAVPKAKAAAIPKAKPKVTKPKTKRPIAPEAKAARVAAITKSFPVSPAFRSFLGLPEVSRPHAIKKIWDYIKANNLQNPLNKREILCDAKLKAIFDGKEKVGLLEVPKLLSTHFVKP